MSACVSLPLTALMALYGPPPLPAQPEPQKTNSQFGFIVLLEVHSTPETDDRAAQHRNTGGGKWDSELPEKLLTQGAGGGGAGGGGVSGPLNTNGGAENNLIPVIFSEEKCVFWGVFLGAFRLSLKKSPLEP